MVESAELPRKGFLLVVLAALLWAVSGSSGKFLFQRGMTPLDLVQVRLTLSALFLLVWLLLTHRSLLKIALGDIFYFACLGIAGMAMVQFTYFSAIAKIQVAVAILLQYLAPMFIALYAICFQKQTLTRTTFLALVSSTVGCYLVVGAYSLDLLSMNRQGVLMGMASGVAFAAYAVMGERGMRRYNTWTVLFYALLFAALFWNVAVPPLKSFQRGYDLVEWGWILYIVILGNIIPYWLYGEGISLIRATRASITATLEPIAAALISFLFLGELLQLPQLLGGALVIASVILLQIRREYDYDTPALIRARKQEAGKHVNTS